MKASGGFTLIELLVVLALLGLLSALAFGSLHDAGEQQRRLTQQDKDAEQLRAVHDLLRDLLSRANPTISRVRRSVNTLSFSGEAKSISFLGPLRLSFGASDIVAYRVDFTDNGEMRLGWHLDRDATGGRTTGNDGVTLLSGLSDDIVMYYGYNRRNEEPRWTSGWIEQIRLPKLVRLRFVWRSQQQDWLFAPLITERTCSPPLSDSICTD